MISAPQRRSGASGEAPLPDSYRPEQALAAFDGESARGAWMPFVWDAARPDTGTLWGWSLVAMASRNGTA